ncbi:cell division protein ZapE [Basilea psittacipulmonis]|uniref:ATPase n=1 Tax=Basilea psittacipulmonis DSM 24701 TaxID=1072685 RepID=A0A077DFV8_9BURK|nr:cell division protein ZapE [Basilea psittacipulmonis]AIL32252.1 ATPase [Basilea psittacipulmonis DSM 24701]
MNVVQYYQKALEEKGYIADQAQAAAIQELQRFYDELLMSKKASSGGLFGLFKSKAPDYAPKGVYLWGGVGRGKSFLMDAFYHTIPFDAKVRLHFHEFMRSVHEQMKAAKNEKDPLIYVAKQVAKKYRLICFDEFHVSDIADAMILYRLLTYLYENGVGFVMTSNYKPDDLYPNGLQRDRFLAAIDLINARMNVLNVDVGTDYRMVTQDQVKRYLTPLGPETDRELEHIFKLLSQGKHEDPHLLIENRELPAKAVGGGVAWFSFDVLCQTARSQNDYLSLSQRFDTIILSNVPQLHDVDFSAARRFTWLLDVMYDHCMQLIISAAVPAEELYTSGAMAGEFVRTVSRLTEMQSVEYTQRTKRNIVSL